MLNTPSVAMSAVAPAPACASARGSARVGVRVAAQLRTREARAVDERGVAEAIEQHALAASGEGADDGEIRHVAAGEQQRALAAREGGELLLQARVLGAVAADQVRGGAAGAGPAPAHSLMAARERRVAREPEVVVAAEVDAAGAR